MHRTETWIILANPEWGYWGILALLLVLCPITLLWTVAIVDLFQRPGLGRWQRGAWLCAIVAIPLFGALWYILVRPGVAPSEDQPNPEYSVPTTESLQAVTRAGQLQTLARLHDSGKLTDSEFAAAKGRLLRDDIRNSRSP